MHLHSSEGLCLLFYQGQENNVAEEANRTESENSSSDENELPRRAWLSLGEESASDEDDSEYEDCREEEEDWQTCSEDSSPEEEEDEEGCARDWKEHCPVDSEAQDRKKPENQQMNNCSQLVSKQELLELLKKLHTGKKVKDGQLTVGLVRWSRSQS